MEEIAVVGRRKTAVARVRIKAGQGNITINKKAIDEHFDRETLKMIATQPLVATESVGKYDIAVNVHGGGVSGQAGAIRHGIARAILKMVPETKRTLRGAGLLTRDPRMKERKKYGQKGARAKFQFSKR